MAITPLPDPPSRSDPANFPERADAFMAALPAFALEANTLLEHVDEAAATVDDDAEAAASSASDAANSQSAASDSAQAASESAAVSTGKANAASQSAALAQAWAAQETGTVAGTIFRSARQYAEQAATGAGLPIYPASAIPTTDQGPIYVFGIGPMEWNATADLYFPLVYFNECRLDGGPTVNQMKLSRHNGPGRVTINGETLIIPEAGLTVAPTGLPVNQIQYMYAYKNAGALAVEWNTTPRATHTDGREIKQGDPSRLLVGMFASAAGGNVFPDAPQSGRMVASWFNKKRKSCWNVNTGAATSSGSPIQAMGMFPALYWKGDAVNARLVARVTNSLGGVACFIQIFNNQNSTYLTPYASAASSPAPNYADTIMSHVEADATGDQLVIPTAMINVSAGTGTFWLHSTVDTFV